MPDPATRSTASPQDAPTDPDLARLLVAPGRSWHVARVISTVTDPALVIVLLTLTAGVWDDGVRGLGWAFLVIVLLVGIPSAVIWFMVRTGRATDHRLAVRRQRVVPMAVAFGAAVVSLVLLHRSGSTPTLTRLIVMILAGIAVGALVNRWTKMSAHSTVMTIAAGFCWLYLSEVAGAFTGALALACGWSRLRLGRHSPSQVMLGLVLGLVVSAGTALVAGPVR